MRRRVMLLSLLCLSAGAFAMAQAFHLRLRLEAIFAPYVSTASTQAPLAALDTSVGKPSSERGSTARTESSEKSEGANETQKPTSDDGAASQSNGVKLDLAQISTSGSTSVFAGRAQPGAAVTVFENGVAVASATANDNGDWSLATDHKFAGPDPKFSLRAGFEKPQKPAEEAPESNSRPQSVVKETASRPLSPSGELLQNFEKTVASAREEDARSQAASPTAAEAHLTPPAAPGVAPAIGNTMQTVSVLSPSPTGVKDHDHLQSASIPVPMTFVFDEATLTSDGTKTAKLLLDYLLLKKFASVTLSGHADERGTAEYNMDLSRKRLDAVSAFLRSGGYHGKLDLIPKGASEPFTGIDRSKYSQDDLMQLDRRVELRNAM